MNRAVEQFQAAVAFFFPFWKTDGFSSAVLRQFSQTWFDGRPHMTQVISSNLSIIAPPQCPHSRAGFLFNKAKHLQDQKNEGLF
jgi:hypothetical protein